MWVVAEQWRPGGRAALARASAEQGSEKRDGGPLQPMTMAEFFGAWAVAVAIAEAEGREPSAVVAVGDCLPEFELFGAGAPASAASGSSPLEAGGEVEEEQLGRGGGGRPPQSSSCDPFKFWLVLLHVLVPVPTLFHTYQEFARFVVLPVQMIPLALSRGRCPSCRP